MPRSPSPSRRLATAARWPVGVAATSWAYMWRTTPMHRREVEGSLPDDAPPPLPPGVDLAERQHLEQGVGPLLRRRYRATIRHPRRSAEELIAHISADPNRTAPSGLARFEKVRGEEGRLAVGDEFVVRMPAPWDGPVRVVEVTSRSFRYLTLAGHLEAGQIEFRAAQDADRVRFEVESWARSGDRLSNLLFAHLPMAKEVQLHMWTSVLERAARLAGGRLTGGVDILTRRVDGIG